jgi:hypothetical protein
VKTAQDSSHRVNSGYKSHFLHVQGCDSRQTYNTRVCGVLTYRLAQDVYRSESDRLWYRDTDDLAPPAAATVVSTAAAGASGRCDL